MVGSNQLIHAVIGLTTRNMFLAINRIWWQLIRPVHPVDAGVDVVLIAGAYLEDSRNPAIIGFRPRTELFPIVHGLLALNGVLVRDEDVVVAKVFGLIHWARDSVSLAHNSSTVPVASIGVLTNKAVVSRHLLPSLGWLNLVVDIHSLVGFELARRREGRHLHRDLGSAIIWLVGVASALLLLLVPVLGVDKPYGEGTFGPVRLVNVTRSLASGSHLQGDCR